MQTSFELHPILGYKELNVVFLRKCILCHNAGDVRPFIRSIFKTHELVDKARNGCLNGSSRDAGSPPSPSAKAAAADAAALSVRGASSSAASTNAMAIAEGSE